MRRRTILRESRLMHAAVGATILAGPVSAALADSPHGASAQAASDQTGPALEAKVKKRRLSYGQAVQVNGHAPSSDSGQTVTLDFAPSGRAAWEQLATGQIAGNGSFHLSAPLHNSGAIRVTAAPPAASAFMFAAAAAAGDSTAPERVTVAAALRLRPHSRTVLGARTVHVPGQLLPRVGGRRVLLQAHRGSGWATIASARTRPGGRFELRYRASAPGLEALRVRFPGGASNAPVARTAGRLTVLEPTTASWYQDGGSTACGFHAHYGVANLSLPCGAKVSFSYGGRMVTAVVDDRGPYVGGRRWDLNQNTAAALGFVGVNTVWSSS